MESIYKGTAWVYGDDVSNDGAVSYSEENKGLSDPKLLAKWCMTSYEPGFPEKAQPGDIIVAGKNFGCGHAHDHFPRSLKGVGIPLVIAESFSGDFYRMIANLGYPLVMTCPDISHKINKGDVIEVNLDTGEIKNFTKNESLHMDPLSDVLRVRFEHGGTKGYLKWLFAQEKGENPPK